MDFLVRKANNNDAGEIALVQVSSWQSTYKGMMDDDFLSQISVSQATKRWSKILDQEMLTYVLELDHQIVGYISGGLQRYERFESYQGELQSIYTYQHVQGQGGGRKLFNAFVEGLKASGIHSMSVIAFSQNTPALKFYEKMGGQFIGTETITIENQDVEESVYGWDSL